MPAYLSQSGSEGGVERLLRYCPRPPFALERSEGPDAHPLFSHLGKSMHDGGSSVPLTPLERIGRIAALIAEPRSHPHR
jgi:hypothetical protein